MGKTKLIWEYENMGFNLNLDIFKGRGGKVWPLTYLDLNCSYVFMYLVKVDDTSNTL